MKANTHPEYHEIKVVATDGEEYTTRTTWGKAGDVMRLDIDPKNHPAWTGSGSHIVERGAIAKFSKKFDGFGIAASTEGKEKPVVKEEAKK